MGRNEYCWMESGQDLWFLCQNEQCHCKEGVSNQVPTRYVAERSLAACRTRSVRPGYVPGTHKEQSRNYWKQIHNGYGTHVVLIEIALFTCWLRKMMLHLFKVDY